MIAVQLQGRLGNNMFQYAVCRTVAEKNGYNFYIQENNLWEWPGGDLFGVNMGIKDGEIKQTFYDTNQQKHNPAIFDVKDFTLLSGYFQSEKNFDHDKAREWFKSKIIIPPVDDNICLIHFRGGDYSVYPWNLYQLPMSYYQVAKEKMLEYNPDMKFVVVTDDIDGARERFVGYDIVSKDIAYDFSLLTQAKYLIICNSTFSWWAAWLSKAIVVAPQGWLLYNSNREVFSPADMRVDRFIWV